MHGDVAPIDRLAVLVDQADLERAEGTSGHLRTGRPDAEDEPASEVREAQRARRDFVVGRVRVLCGRRAGACEVEHVDAEPVDPAHIQVHLTGHGADSGGGVAIELPQGGTARRTRVLPAAGLD